MVRARRACVEGSRGLLQGAHWMLARRRLPERRLPLERTEEPTPPPPPAPTASPLRAFRFCGFPEFEISLGVSFQVEFSTSRSAVDQAAAHGFLVKSASQY